jgi:hypothetical protein
MRGNVQQVIQSTTQTITVYYRLQQGMLQLLNLKGRGPGDTKAKVPSRENHSASGKMDKLGTSNRCICCISVGTPHTITTSRALTASTRTLLYLPPVHSERIHSQAMPHLLRQQDCFEQQTQAHTPIA